MMSSGLARLWYVSESLGCVHSKTTLSTSQTPIVVITYDSTRHGTYHQNGVPSLGAMPPNGPTGPPPHHPTPVTRSSHCAAAATRSPFAQSAPRDITRELALKTIPKKKVEGNEESMWGEVRCGGAPTTSCVSFPQPFFLHDAPARARPHLSPNMFGCLPVVSYSTNGFESQTKYFAFELTVGGELIERLSQCGHFLGRDAVAVLRYVRLILFSPG